MELSLEGLTSHRYNLWTDVTPQHQPTSQILDTANFFFFFNSSFTVSTPMGNTKKLEFYVRKDIPVATEGPLSGGGGGQERSPGMCHL